MKRKSARELLAESFRELAEKKNIDKITIQDIVTNCGYSPATFYRNFKDKYDLIAWEYAGGTARIMERIGSDGYGWRQALLDSAYRFQREKEYLANLFLNTTGRDSFIYYMAEVNFHEMKKHILANSRRKEMDELTEMVLRIYCLGTVNLTCEWILGKYESGPEELAEVYEESLPISLRQYLE